MMTLLIVRSVFFLLNLCYFTEDGLTRQILKKVAVVVVGRRMKRVHHHQATITVHVDGSDASVMRSVPSLPMRAFISYSIALLSLKQCWTYCTL